VLLLAYCCGPQHNSTAQHHCRWRLPDQAGPGSSRNKKCCVPPVSSRHTSLPALCGCSVAHNQGPKQRVGPVHHKWTQTCHRDSRFLCISALIAACYTRAHCRNRFRSTQKQHRPCSNTITLCPCRPQQAARGTTARCTSLRLPCSPCLVTAR
jgi:hypothetical protein